MPISNEPTEPSIVLPRRIASYNALGLLGRGRSTNVLLSLRRELGVEHDELVVVKRPRAARAAQEGHFLQMFYDEARLGVRLHHPNIARVYEVGYDGELPFIAMEFLRGQALSVVMHVAREKQAPIPVPAALQIFYDVLDALTYAHELQDVDGAALNIVHRDVTPTNIFVEYGGVTKVVDFGIAKSSMQREKTGVGMIKGKMAYMAPEQFRDEPLTRAIDLWAAGVVLWELLTGERLFAAKNDAETIRQVMSRPIPAPSTLRADVPAALDAGVLAALARDPAARPESVRALKARCEAAAGDRAGVDRDAVAAMMRALFAEVVPKNEATLAAYQKNRSAEVAAGTRFLRFNDRGLLEMHSDVSEIPVTGKRVSALDDVLKDVPEQVVARRKSPSDRPSAATPAPGPGAARAAVARRAEPEPRPAWHWVALLGGLALLGTAIWFVLGR